MESLVGVCLTGGGHWEDDTWTNVQFGVALTYLRGTGVVHDSENLFFLYFTLPSDVAHAIAN